VNSWRSGGKERGIKKRINNYKLPKFDEKANMRD
jgi:hypothetical protein